LNKRSTKNVTAAPVGGLLIRELLVAGLEPPDIIRLTGLSKAVVLRTRRRLVQGSTEKDRRAAPAAHGRYVTDPAYRAAVLERVKSWQALNGHAL
jgi:hypothetical protein